ncbi:Golgi apparatus membrane protein TVP23 [Pseudocercospora fuligena]|uniref:Golgi apparatus membrane protein TVP23 n=1 Tax=Pseudocercospora fuligena TaxID=685502 RepID=A0A8H6RWI1_9PEZI|nr:Golgi apparatus membrane protein TVP23 [Pseudocercospora fuligena]
MADIQNEQGQLNWRLSAHPITLLTFLGFRIFASSGDSHWVFESAPQPNEPGGKTVTATDKRFFWMALYVQPALWIALAILALVRLRFIWLTLVAIALVLTITNTLAFSRCDKFSQASGLVERGLYSGSLARNVGGALVSRLFTRGS